MSDLPAKRAPKKRAKKGKRGKSAQSGKDGLELGTDKLYFKIGEVADIVEVAAHVLRYWESEFRMRPQRSASGQRMYRRKDIARFLRIRKLLHDEGFTIAGARKVFSEGAASTAPQAGGADSSRLGDALQRIADVRARVAARASTISTAMARPRWSRAT